MTKLNIFHVYWPLGSSPGLQPVKHSKGLLGRGGGEHRVPCLGLAVQSAVITCGTANSSVCVLGLTPAVPSWGAAPRLLRPGSLQGLRQRAPPPGDNAGCLPLPLTQELSGGSRALQGWSCTAASLMEM